MGNFSSLYHLHLLQTICGLMHHSIVLDIASVKSRLIAFLGSVLGVGT